VIPKAFEVLTHRHLRFIQAPEFLSARCIHAGAGSDSFIFLECQLIFQIRVAVAGADEQKVSVIFPNKSD
jgi:hypothetical protein